MQTDQLVGQVQSRAKLSSRGQAEGAVRATLETLAERIQSTQAENLADQLPREIGEHLRRVVYAPDEPVTGARMTQQEFFDRVAQRGDFAPPQAAYVARCVIEVVDEATEGGLMAKIRQALDDELGGVLFSGSSGTARS